MEGGVVGGGGAATGLFSLLDPPFSPPSPSQQPLDPPPLTTHLVFAAPLLTTDGLGSALRLTPPALLDTFSSSRGQY